MLTAWHDRYLKIQSIERLAQIFLNSAIVYGLK